MAFCLWEAPCFSTPPICEYQGARPEGMNSGTTWQATSPYQFYIFALETKRRNLTAASSLSLLRALDLDRGWSMTLSSALPIVLFALALAGVTRADNQQAQQSSVNAAICLLAVRSRSSPDRRSDLQARRTDLGCCQRFYLIIAVGRSSH